MTPQQNIKKIAVNLLESVSNLILENGLTFDDLEQDDWELVRYYIIIIETELTGSNKTQHLYDLITQKKIVEAKAELKRLKDVIGNDNYHLVKARVLIHRLEIIGK